MKKTLLFVVVALLPLLVLAKPERLEREFMARHLLTNPNRAYRMSQLAEYYYYDNVWNAGGVYEYFYNPYHPARLDSTSYKWWDSYEQTWTYEGSSHYY